MTLQLLDQIFTVCQLGNVADADLTAPFTFLARTDEEISLVCPVQSCPSGALNRQDGWKSLRIPGVLDFSLIGILAGLFPDRHPGPRGGLPRQSSGAAVRRVHLQHGLYPVPGTA